MRMMLCRLFMRIAARLHSHEWSRFEFDPWAYEHVFTPDGQPTGKCSARVCRVCGEQQEFEYNRRQFNYVKVGEINEYCEFCGSRESVSVIPWGSVCRYTPVCNACRDKWRRTAA